MPFGEPVGDAMHDYRPDHYANEHVSGGIPPLTAALGTRRGCSPECSQPVDLGSTRMDATPPAVAPIGARRVLTPLLSMMIQQPSDLSRSVAWSQPPATFRIAPTTAAICTGRGFRDDLSKETSFDGHHCRRTFPWR